MSLRQVNIDRETPMLLPPDLREWVQQDDLAHFLVDGLALVDLSCAAMNTRGTGSQQYPPGMMLAVLIYCYAQGIFSSRQIERATYQHVSVRYLSANTHPDHDTICTFRRTNGRLLRSVFVQLLQLAQGAGLVKLGILALDGTKLEANASKRKTLSLAQLDEQLRQLDEQVGQLLQQAEEADQVGEGSQEMPKELVDAQVRRARLAEAKAQLEEQARARHAQREEQRRQRPAGDRPPPVNRHPKAKDKINLTDSQSTLTPTARQGYVQGYNAQLVVSTDAQGLIVAADVVRDTNDIQQLSPMLEQTRENLGQAPKQVLVDAGYGNVRQILAAEEQAIEVLCPLARSANARAELRGASPWRRRRKAVAQRLRERCQTPEGRGLYQLRGTTVEPAIGIIKNVLGFVRFNLRGLANVRTEWQLVTLAFNCRRLAARWS